jgi:nitroreductase
MNQIIENIKQRRSVRSYKEDKIDKKIVSELISAGTSAPTGANSQPWRFVVAESDAFRKKIAKLSVPYYKKWLSGMPEAFRKMREGVDAESIDVVYYGAPLVVFVIGKGMTADFDCSMACENMMLAARSLGIGSCWVFIGSLVAKEKEIADAFGMTEGEKIYGPIIFGYPKDGFPEEPEKRPVDVRWL